MALLGSHIQSFIIKIWLEDTTQSGGRGAWRGQISHGPGGERRSLREFNDILWFIIPYLEEAGVKPRLWWRLRRWLRQRQ